MKIKKTIIGVYSITNIFNGKIYIGSTVDIYRRLKSHINTLKRGRHENEHLQNAWDIYGPQNFLFKIECFCEKKVLSDLENFYMVKYRTLEREYGYNIASPFRLIVSEETKRKISKGNRGKRRSLEEAERLRNLRKGTKLSLEVCQHLSNVKKGRKLSEEHKKKIGMKTKNRVVTQETRNKISKSRLGKRWSEEQKIQMSISRKGKMTGINNPMYGKIVSEKTKSAISIANRGKHSNLTPEIVKNIKVDIFINGMKLVDISKKYSIRLSNASHIKHGYTWSHIDYK